MEENQSDLPVEETDHSSDTSNRSGAAARIKALDRVTSANLRTSQIINKVSDIVRELVENALDAGATTIQVHLEKFGKDKIEVRDNGHGLLPSDVKQIFRGGYTSKLQDNSNLSRGKFLGFKGEALNAICAAGNVTVISKTQAESAATKYKFNMHGIVTSESKVAHNVGTTITVEKLFENIRVRRQRLDNAATGANELKEIEAYLKGAGIAYPKCHMSLFHNTSLLWTKASVQTVEQALIAVLGHSMAKKLRKCGPLKIDVENERKEDENSFNRSVELYLPVKPVDMRTMSYTSNKMTMIFCNQKRVYIREFEKLIHRYIVANVEKPQPADQRRFPVSVVSIQVPPKEADFNLDMDKTKVLLVHKDKIKDMIEEALIKFYEVDLRNCDEEGTTEDRSTSKSVVNGLNSVQCTVVADTITTTTATAATSTLPPPPNHSVGTSSKMSLQSDKSDVSIVTNIDAGQTEMQLNSSSDSLSSILNITSTSKTNRQNTIEEFLRDIPSQSLAFACSPTKSKGTEPTSIQFPSSRPMPTERNETIYNSLKKRSSHVVANFQISLDSPPSQTQLDTQKSSQVNTDDTSNAITKEMLDKKSDAEQNGIGEVELQNWLDGRMTDKFGDIIENVVVVNEAPKTSEKDDLGRFRSALLAGSTSSSNLNKSFRSEFPPVASPFSQANPFEPPAKRLRKDNLGNPASYHPIPLATSTPRMPTPSHKQTTLDSFAKWPTSGNIFSQTASQAVVGVRLPLTPVQPQNSPAPGITIPNPRNSHNSSVRPNESMIPKSLTAWEQQQFNFKQQAQSVPSKTLNNTNTSFIAQQKTSDCPGKKLTPLVHRELQGISAGTCGQLYVAQTNDSVGIFSPLNMLEYFPNECREICSSTTSPGNPSSPLSLNMEEVSRMFQQFVARSEINSTSVARKIFFALSKLPNLTQSIMLR